MYHSSKNNTRLFVTKDKHSQAYFVRTEVEKIARFENLNNEWFVWIYPYGYSFFEKKLTDCLNRIEKIFGYYWVRTYK